MRAIDWLGGCLVVVAGTGCGSGTSLIASSGGGGDTAQVEVVATTVSARTPSDGQSGRVSLLLDVTVDPSQSLVVTSVEYSLVGDVESAFRTATPAMGFPADVVVGASISGTEVRDRDGQPLRFDWNASFDLDREMAMPLNPLLAPVTGKAVLRARVRNASTGAVFTAKTSEFLLDEGLVQTIAGGGVGDGSEPQQAAMLGPGGIDSDAEGFLLVADTGNHRIRLIDRDAAQGLRIRTVVGNGFRGVESGVGSALETSLSLPTSVAVLPGGDLAIAEVDDALGGVVRLAQAETNLITELIDDSFLAVELQKPVDLALSDVGGLFVADETGNSVWRLDTGAITFPFPLGPLDVRFFFGFDRPVSVAVAPIDTTLPGESAEEVFVLEAGGLVRTIEGLTVSTKSVVGGGAVEPTSIVFDPASPVAATSIALTDPTGIAVDDEHVYVCDRGAVGAFVLVVSRDSGDVVDVVQDPRIQHPAGVEVDPFGTLFVVEEGDGALATGATGQMVVAIELADTPGAATTDAVAGEGGLKTVTQEIGDLAMQQDGVDASADGGL